MPRLPEDVRKYYIYRALLKRFILPVLVVYGLDRGLSLEQLSLVAGIGSVMSFFLEVPSGALADHIGHKKALIISMLGQALSMVCYLGGSFWWILLGAGMYFAFGSLMTGTSEAIFYERLKALGLEHDHAKLYGQGKGFATAVSIGSMALAGIFYELAWWLPFAVGAIQYLAAAAIISTFGPTKQTVSVQKQEGLMKFFTHFGEAMRAIWHNPKAFWLTMSSALIIGPLFALGDFQQAVMTELGMSVTVIGLVYALKRVFSVGLQSYTYKITKVVSPFFFTFVCALMMVSHLLLVGVIHDPWLILIPFVIGSISWTGLEVATNEYLNKLLDTGSRATALSMTNLARSSIQVLTLIVFAWLSHKSASFAYSSIGLIVGFALVVPLVKLYEIYHPKH